MDFSGSKKEIKNVTILILIDGFLQYYTDQIDHNTPQCHNPYFNRWFSAIMLELSDEQMLEFVTILILIDGFLQCTFRQPIIYRVKVTILILIDGFLQSVEF